MLSTRKKTKNKKNKRVCQGDFDSNKSSATNEDPKTLIVALANYVVVHWVYNSAYLSLRYYKIIHVLIINIYVYTK